MIKGLINRVLPYSSINWEERLLTISLLLGAGSVTSYLSWYNYQHSVTLVRLIWIRVWGKQAPNFLVTEKSGSQNVPTWMANIICLQLLKMTRFLFFLHPSYQTCHLRKPTAPASVEDLLGPHLTNAVPWDPVCASSKSNQRAQFSKETSFCKHKSWTQNHLKSDENQVVH